MQVLLCVCFIAAFICSAVGQGSADAFCEGVADFALCPGTTWTCDLEVSQCFCKSEAPYCRCNTYIDEFYLGKTCHQKWTTLTFILVATLPGVALAFVIGVTVHIAHKCSSKSHRASSAGHELAHIPEQEMFPGVVFASDLGSRPAPKPTPVQVGVPMASTRPYSVSDNTQFASRGPPMGAPHPQYNAPGNTRPAFERPPMGAQYSVPEKTHSAFDRPPPGASYSAPENTRFAFDRPPPGASYSRPPSSPTLVPEQHGQQPYSYTGGGAQVLSNPYARVRNPYEEHNPSSDLYNHASPRAYEEQRMASPPGGPEYRSALPRAQIGRPY